jgi:hypothetical protein
MNVVMDDATEVYNKDDKASVPLGMPAFLLLRWPLTRCRPNSPQRREHHVDTTLATLVTQHQKCSGGPTLVARGGWM